MDLLPLPSEVENLLLKTNAAPRLQAHLALVHDVAHQITSRMMTAWPKLEIDQRAVLLGAATHDIGKVRHPKELSQAGHEHELAGRDLLSRYGWSDEISRFAVTHASHLTADDPIEDLLVALADNVWRGKREEGLELVVATRVATVSGQDPWQAWIIMDHILSQVSQAATERLLWQSAHPL